MSGLVDMWTTELVKLREKGRTISQNNSAQHVPSKVESSQQQLATTTTSTTTSGAKEGNLLAGKLQAFVQEMKMNSLPLPYSEASVSMLVDCFSP